MRIADERLKGEEMEACQSCEWRPLTDDEIEKQGRVSSTGNKFIECEICEKITFSTCFHMSASFVCSEGVKLCKRCKKAVSKAPHKCPRVTHYRIDPAIPPFEL